MTPLGRRLARRIAADGPITIADYMAACLLDPDDGYYATRDPFGADGDFVTAPEISQMFGEMIGLCLAQAWIDQDRPAPFALVEMGPGRGTLMADLLRATAAVPGFLAAARSHLIEASATLRQIQAKTLSRTGTGAAPVWLDSAAQLPDMPVLAIANEFLDALPIRQFQRGAGPVWHERQIGLDPDGALRLGLAPPAPLGALDHRLADTAPGDLVEICPGLSGAVQPLAARIARHGGAALFVDYGGWRSLGDTLQAVRRHAPAPLLQDPGAADLTAHVDFEAVARAACAAGPAAGCSQMIQQGVFLERLGITPRAQILASRLTGQALQTHVAAHRRLTHPEEMGSLFHVIAVVSKDAPLPPGLTP